MNELAHGSVCVPIGEGGLGRGTTIFAISLLAPFGHH